MYRITSMPSRSVKRLFSYGHLSFSTSTNTSTSPDILLERNNRKLDITMYRTKALNALTLPMIRKIYPELRDALTGKHPTELVLIRGAGKAFCAGGDVLAVSNAYKSGDPNRVYEKFFREEYQLNHLIGSLNVPYVAFIHGITMGGGCGLSLHGRFRVATECTMLAMPETALGLFPDVGGTYFLPRLPGQLGMFLALTGHRLHGSDAYHAGMATHFVDLMELFHIRERLLELGPSKCSPTHIDDILRYYQQLQDIPSFSLDPHLELIDHCFAADSVEGIIERLKQRAEKDDNEFAREQLKQLAKMSPTSLKVTFRQIRLGAKLSFDEVFPLEYRLTQRFLAANDFHEGCRAILIDKDRNPKWKPASLAEVNDEMVDAYFAPFDNPEKELKLEQI